MKETPTENSSLKRGQKSIEESPLYFRVTAGDPRALARALSRAFDDVAAAAEPRSVARAFAEEAARVFDAKMWSVFLYRQAEGRELEESFSAGLPPDLQEAVEVMGRSPELATPLAGTGRPFVLDATGFLVHPEAARELATQHGLSCVVSAPLMDGEQLLALSILYFTTGALFTEADVEVLRILSAHAALALSRARLSETRRWEQSAQDQFLDVLGHELRTPLTSIMGFAQMIRRRLANSPGADPRFRDQLNLLWVQALRLNRLLDAFVDISSIERGAFEVDHAPVDATAALSTAVEQAQAQARSKHRIDAQLPESPIWVRGDQRRLEHAFNHLISNALRYSPEDKPVYVVAQALGETHQLEIAIADRGPGIPVDLRREIFKRFYPSDARRAGGMGVGLYVSRAVVEAHGGHLDIENPPGGGTTVKIVLPQA